MSILLTVIIGLGTSFIGSMLGFVVAIHYDLEGYWQQRHIEKGRKMEERARVIEKRGGYTPSGPVTRPTTSPPKPSDSHLATPPPSGLPLVGASGVIRGRKRVIN